MKYSNNLTTPSDLKPGEIFTRPDGTKARAGIDGEVFSVREDRELFNLFPDAEELGVETKDDTIRIAKGEAVEVQILNAEAEPRSVVWHRWPGGLSLTCPKETSPFLLNEADRGRECPLCDAH